MQSGVPRPDEEDVRGERHQRQRCRGVGRLPRSINWRLWATRSRAGPIRRVSRYGDCGVRHERPGWAGESRGDAVRAVGGTPSGPRSRRRRRGQGLRDIVICRHADSPADDRTTCAGPADEAGLRCGVVASRSPRRRRCASRCRRRGRQGSPTTSSVRIASRRPRANAQLPLSPPCGLRVPGTGVSRRCAGWIRRPSRAPAADRRVGDTEYLLFYEGQRLHMVAWQRNKTLYWVLNTLDNELSNDLMLGLATSFKPVR